MSCENYREALTEAAATNAAPSRDLRAHLDGCSACHAFFAEELQLFSAIVTGLHATFNTEVPALFFPRVRAKLREKSFSRRTWIPAFATIAAAAAIVFAIFFIRSGGRGAVERNPNMSAAVRIAVPPERKTVPPVVPPVETSRRSSKDKPPRPARTAPVILVQGVAVLIPPGQKQAIDALLASVQQGEVKADVLLAEKPEKPLQELQVSPLSISPIEIKPLVDVSAEPVSPNERTRR